MQLGVENTAGQTDVREQVEFAVEQDSATDCDSEYPIQPLYERLRGPNPWPDLFQPSLKPCTMEYVKQLCRIAHDIREAMCLALGLDKHALDSLFDDATGKDPPHWVLKMVSYPPSNDSSCSFGVGAHTDTNFLTLVLQDSVGGLQVFSEGKVDGCSIQIWSERACLQYWRTSTDILVMDTFLPHLIESYLPTNSVFQSPCFTIQNYRHEYNL